jgi:hypothetical protein
MRIWIKIKVKIIILIVEVKIIIKFLKEKLRVIDHCYRKYWKKWV